MKAYRIAHQRCFDIHCKRPPLLLFLHDLITFLKRKNNVVDLFIFSSVISWDSFQEKAFKQIFHYAPSPLALMGPVMKFCNQSPSLSLSLSEKLLIATFFRNWEDLCSNNITLIDYIRRMQLIDSMLEYAMLVTNTPRTLIYMDIIIYHIIYYMHDADLFYIWVLVPFF